MRVRVFACQGAQVTGLGVVAGVRLSRIPGHAQFSRSSPGLAYLAPVFPNKAKMVKVAQKDLLLVVVAVVCFCFRGEKDSHGKGREEEGIENCL